MGRPTESGDGLGAGPAVAGDRDRPPAIRASTLTVSLGGRRVLSRVSTEIPAGRFVAVVGANGAGKTTLLRCLGGLLSPETGAVEIEGRALAAITRRELARIVSFVAQGDVRADDLTVREFVDLGRFPWVGPWGSFTAADAAAVREALEVTGTEPFADRRLGSLSGGERQRVAIAAALAQGGRILLLDEPTAALDVRHQIQVLGLLDRLHRSAGLTVVAVTHDLNSLVAASDAVIALRGGEVAFEGTPAELLETPVLEEVFEAAFARIPRWSGGLPVVVPESGAR